jgi:hypothetical protein
MSPSDVFKQVRIALESAGIRYAVGGSWASTAFGEPRFTNDVDIVTDFTPNNVTSFLHGLPESFYADADEAQAAIGHGRSFNVIYMPTVLKFDFFPAAAFPLGTQELERAVWLTETGLSEEPAPFVTPEDILLAKLYWFRLGGESSEVQWRDIRGVVRGCGAALNRDYLEQNAVTLRVRDLLEKALTPTS